MEEDESLGVIRTLSTIRAAASEFVARAMFGSGAGVTYGGARDVDAQLGYKATLEAADYYARYRRNGIARRVVNAAPQATWRGIPELIEDPDPDTWTPFELAWLALDLRKKVWSTFLRADKLAGLGRFSAIVIGAPGTYETELGRMKPGTIGYLRAYSEIDIDIDEKDWVFEPQDPRFGQPMYYKISRLVPSLKRTTSTKIGSNTPKVHWSRIIHVADGLLDDDVFGEPRMECVWNRLDDLEKVIGGGSEAFWLAARRILHFNVDKNVKTTPENKKKMEDETDEIVHGLRRVLRTKGMNVESVGHEVANFNPQVDAIMTLIAGSTEIPKRLFTGSELGELASSQDRSNWADRIHDRRLQYAGPFVVRQFVDRMIKYGELPTPAEYTIRWPEMSNLTPTERAALAKTMAEVNQAQRQDVFTANEIRDFAMSFEKRDDLDDDATDSREEDVNLDQDDEEIDATDKLKAAKARLRAAKLRDKQKKELRRKPRQASRPEIIRPVDRVSDEEDTRQQELARLEAARTQMLPAILETREIPPITVNLPEITINMPGQPSVSKRIVRTANGFEITPLTEDTHA